MAKWSIKNFLNHRKPKMKRFYLIQDDKFITLVETRAIKNAQTNREDSSSKKKLMQCKQSQANPSMISKTFWIICSFFHEGVLQFLLKSTNNYKLQTKILIVLEKFNEIVDFLQKFCFGADVKKRHCSYALFECAISQNS